VIAIEMRFKPWRLRKGFFFYSSPALIEDYFRSLSFRSLLLLEPIWNAFTMSLTC